ncbi:MAG: DUF4251 domain-containing protein [Candidatus Cryptobacteroides sp.]
MKTKYLIMSLLLVYNALASLAQTQQRIYTKAEQESSQLREIEKRIEEVRDSIMAVEALESLISLDFVLEADRLVFKRGEVAYVSSATNFISVSDANTVIQVAPFNGGGPNGVGGITIEGKASNIILKTDKKGNTTMTMDVFGTGLSATIDISLPRDSYKASVVVNPNLHSNRVTLHGVLIPSAKSSIFKGRAL